MTKFTYSKTIRLLLIFAVLLVSLKAPNIFASKSSILEESKAYIEKRRKLVKDLKTNELDPNKHVYGIPFGSQISAFKEMFGEPNGQFRFGSKSAGLLYGSNHIFYFQEKKFVGILIAHSLIFNQSLRRQLEAHKLDYEGWYLSNGVKLGSPLSFVKEKVSGFWNGDTNTYYFETTSAFVWLYFSFSVEGTVFDLERQVSDDSFKVTGIKIELK